MITPGGKIPNVIALSRGPTVAARAMTKSKTGNAIVISVIREMTVSIDAAEVAGDRAQEDPDEHHADRREDGDLERDAGAEEQAQELVLAEPVRRAEDEEVRLAGVRILEMSPRLARVAGCPR